MLYQRLTMIPRIFVETEDVMFLLKKCLNYLSFSQLDVKLYSFY